MTDAVASSLTVDRQRRTTIPRDVLEAAGIPAGASLVVRAEAPGRIVMESPALLLKELQQWIAEGTAALNAAEGTEGTLTPLASMAEELLAERAAEADAEAERDEARAAFTSAQQTDKRGRA